MSPNYFSFASLFYKQPVYKQLDLGCQKYKQLLGLESPNISNFPIFTFDFSQLQVDFHHFSSIFLNF